jgi:hypothetical protein
MNRDGIWVRVLCTTGLALVLGSGTTLAQESSSAAGASAAAEQGTAPAKQPSRRERRRNAEAAAAAATATTTATAAPTAAAGTDSAQAAEPKIVCKNIKPIGSRVERRICGTEEQWAASSQSTSADAQEGMRQVRDRSGVTGGGGGGPASLGTPTMGQ